jgi:hypothetical protein
MKWFKKKGLCFNVGLEVLCGIICLVGALAAVMGYVFEAIIGAAVVGVIGIFAAGGDVSI